MNIITLEELNASLSYVKRIKLQNLTDTIKQRCKDANNKIKFIGFENEYRKTYSNLVFECVAGHRFVRNAHTIRTSVPKCEQCNTNLVTLGKGKFTNEQAIDKIKDRCYEANMEFIRFIDADNYTRAKTSKFELKCNVCGELFTTSYTAFITHRNGCKICLTKGFSDTAPAMVYVFGLIKEGKMIGVKYGITRDIKKRIMALRQASSYEYDIMVITTKHFKEGRYARSIEGVIKEHFKNHTTLSKQQLTLGYTETLTADHLPELLTKLHELT